MIVVNDDEKISVTVIHKMLTFIIADSFIVKPMTSWCAPANCDAIVVKRVSVL